ncbi:MAG: DUF2723 domain-containing protein, partial [Bacteroidales bacterium]|nr:DUF2723 domain-containing protein [Bacteroidales bacterium]
MYAVIGSGIVGALAYTFSDSFWFSAVEGEVYAMSSFFTAIVFWAILKWEIVADKKYSYRWLIFIAYLIGLSIGVHLLNLLAIPAITFVYYFKKYKNPTRKGIIKTLIASFLILAFVMYGIVPWIVKLAGNFELFFINVIGLPFNSGTVIYFVLLIGGIIWGLNYTRKRGKVILNTIILGLIFILIGYSSFFLLIIRSNANPPIDENNPEDAISLLSYLNREQYGDWPLLYGQYFNAPRTGNKDGNPVYRKDKKKGKYIVIDDRKDLVPVYDPQFSTIFPRMWSNTEKRYIDDYKKWVDFKGTPIQVQDYEGKTEIINKPTFSENLKFLFKYQLGHMYYRYFMWNFVGRQNDIQGYVDKKDGNWLSGIKFIDEWRLGPQDNLPDSKKSKANNKFYFLPLILGLIGFFFQMKKDYKDSIIVILLFIMTGIAIVIYLNQYSPQPRERDYAYAASFYPFAIWIGLGVLALYNALSRKLEPKLSAISITLITLILVPVIMAAQGWNDHNRSGRYTALDFAQNYLNSCAPNAILFTNGDNDTFPLWYVQEVEGIRTDVRVVNLSLLNTEWYIDQMKRKAYDSDPVPFSLTKDKYKEGTRNYTYFIEKDNIKDYVDIKDLFNIIAKDESKLKLKTQMGSFDYFPTKKFKISVDSAYIVDNGVVSKEFANEIVPAIKWKLNRSGVQKNHLMVLDLLATNNWERPVYFAITTGSNAYIGLEDYFELEGLTYHLIPIKTENSDGQTGRINTPVMYDNLMNKFKFGNMQDPDVYLDETNMRMTMNLRNNFYRLANALIQEGRKDSAVKVLDKCMEVMPDKSIPFNYFVLPIAEAYYEVGEIDKANKIVERLIDIFDQDLGYYFSFTGKKAKQLDSDKQQSLALLQRLSQVTLQYDQADIAKKSGDIFDMYYNMYIK